LFEKFADEIPGGRWTHVGEVFGKQFKPPFWKRPGWYSNTFSIDINRRESLIQYCLCLASRVVTQRMMDNDNNHPLSSLPPDDHNSPDNHNSPEPQQTDPPVTDHYSPEPQQIDPPVTDPSLNNILNF